MDEASFEYRLYHADKRMVDHSVAKRRGRDQARLGVGDPEAAVITRLVGTTHQLPSQAQQFPFQVKKESSRSNLATLAPKHMKSRSVQVFKREQLAPEISRTFQDERPDRLRRWLPQAGAPGIFGPSSRVFFTRGRQAGTRRGVI